MIKNRDEWQKAFEKQMDIAEKRNIGFVKKHYQAEYKKGIDAYFALGPTNYDNIFTLEGFTKIYEKLYSNISMRYAKWYARNFDKYITKGVDPNEFEDIWNEKFALLGNTVAAQRVTLVSGTAKKTLINIIAGFMADESFMVLGVVEQGRMLRNAFNRYSLNQATRLVRTEATAAANFGTLQSAETLFPKSQMKKEWIASFDDRTRDAHVEADGTIVNYNDSFLVGGDFMQFPGDPAGSAANVVNCRCSIAPFPDDSASGISGVTDIDFGVAGQQTGF